MHFIITFELFTQFDTSLF